MELTLRICDCGSPDTHARFHEPGGDRTEPFSSQKAGNFFLSKLVDQGNITEEDASRARDALKASILPAEPVELSEETFAKLVLKLHGAPPSFQSAILSKMVREGLIRETTEEAIYNTLDDPDKMAKLQADQALKSRIDGLSKLPPEKREEAITHGVESGMISSEAAETLREKLKDIPFKKAEIPAEEKDLAIQLVVDEVATLPPELREKALEFIAAAGLLTEEDLPEVRRRMADPSPRSGIMIIDLSGLPAM